MLSYFILGAFSLLAQLFVLREISGLLTAHEAALGLGLSAWLLWTAAGLALARTRTLAGRLEGPAGFLTAGAAFVSAAGVNLLLLRAAGALMTPGLLPGLLQFVLFSFLLPLPAALANGICLGRGLLEKNLRFYRAEAAGAAAGGLVSLAHAFYFPGTDPLFICGTAAAGFLLSAPAPRRAKFAAVLLAAPVFIAGPFLVPPFALPPSFKDASSYARTTGSRLAVIDSEGRKLFLEDGAPLAHLPLTEQSETYMQLALLAHPRPGAVLFTGPAGFFLAPEAAKHGAGEIAVADPDRSRTDFLLSRSDLAPGRVITETRDARALLRERPTAYDLIFQTVPEPLNAAANRFFTREFFAEAAKALKKGGILAFSLPFSENYLPPERAYLAATVLASASAAFRNVRLIPGGTLTALASDQPLELSPEKLSRRYSARRLKNRFVVPANIPYLLDPYRAQWAAAVLGKVKKPPLNTDLNPAAYFYLWKAWLAMFVSPASMTGLALILLALALTAGRLPSAAAGFVKNRAMSAVFLAGFWAMGFELVCLFAFQNFSGQLNWRLGALFAVFMAGSSAGAWAAGNAFPRAAGTGAGAAALALSAGLWYFLPRTEFLREGLVFPAFAALLFCGGAALGGFFAAASRSRGENCAGFYYSDLLGAALGGFVFSAALIPLAGLRAALLCAAAAASAGLILSLIPEKLPR